jgi:hypothetical protein
MEKVILDAPVFDVSGVKDSAVSDIEKSAVSDIFKKVLNIDPSEVSRINSKFVYDYYKVKDGDDQYAIKISYLSADPSLEAEAANLDKVNAKYPNLISPIKLASGSDEDLTYIIISYEQSESIESLSINELFSYDISFVTMMDAMHEVDISSSLRLGDKLNFDRSIIDMQEEIPQSIVDFMIEEHGISNPQITTITKKVSNYIIENYNEENLVFSNFNISKSTLLLRDGIVKCTNFESCYALNVFLSLKLAFTNIGLYNKSNIEKQLVKSYATNSTIFNMGKEEFLSKYQSSQKVNKLIIFSDLFSKQLFQIYGEGIGNQPRLYKNFEKYNHIRDDVKEVIGEDIRIVDKLFNNFLANHIE